MTHPRIVAMLANPVNRAIVAYVRKRGAASKDEIASHLQASGIDAMSGSRLSQLAGKGVLVNTTPRGGYARYVLGNRAELFDAPVPPHAHSPKPRPALELETDEDPSPAWVGQKAPPPAYDVMRAPPYQPPSFASARPGADDFRDCPSRGHRC